MRDRPGHIATVALLLLLSGCARPLHWGSVTLDGLKGVCHLTSQRDETEFPLDVLRLKLAYAADAGVQLSRGPHVQPWMLPTLAVRIRQVFDLLRAAGIEPVVVIGADPRAGLDDWRRHCRAVAKLLPVHQAQLLTYLKLSDRRLGFLLNWNVPLMKQGIKRMVNNL